MKTSLRISLLIVFCMVLVGSVHPTQAESARAEFSSVDDYIAQAMRRLPIKGMVIAIVKGEQTVYMKGYGTANSAGEAATPQTPWPMGSVTKSFTALAIRQLEQAGKIDLDASLQTYLPEFRLADRQAAARITLRHLIDHESGLSKQEGEAPYLYSPDITFAQGLERLSQYRPVVLAGQHAEYSNWNYVLLAQVISRVTGIPYAEYVQANIFAPLKMSHSLFADYQSIPHIATGNLIVYGLPVPYQERYVPVMMGASSLTSTAEDMTHLMSLFLGKGKYQDQLLLPAHGQGSYAPMWDWQSGGPASATTYGVSGGHNSISTSCVIYPGKGMAVVLLLNTRLDFLPGSVSAYDLATGIGNIVNDLNFRPPSGQGFYAAWAGLDVLMAFLVTCVVWQAARVKKWWRRFSAGSKPFKVFSYLLILFDLLACMVILYFPTLLDIKWNSAIFFLPELAIPLLTTAIGCGALGLYKIARTRI